MAFSSGESREGEAAQALADCRKALRTAQEDVTAAQNTIAGYTLRQTTREKRREELENQLRGEFAEYGIHIASFFINDISAPENDPAVKQLKAALAKRAEMDILGYN